MLVFDLNRSISEWRRQMSAGGIKATSVLDELESHLREDVEQRMRSGAIAERAFQEAVQQVGSPDALKLEFGKVSFSQPRFNQRKPWVWCAGAAVFVFLVETWTLMASDATPLKRLLGLVLISAIAGYIGLLPYLNRLLRPGVRGWSLRAGIAKACNCGAVLWVCLLLLSTVNVTLVPAEIVFSVVCWALFAAATMTVIILAQGTDPTVLDLWTPGAWQSFEIAGVEASRFHHDFIGTEHVLLGLLEQENSSVPKVLRKLGVSSETVRAEIEKIVGNGPGTQTTQSPPYTPRAKKALHIAIQEAKALRSERVDTEHIFLGLLREGGGVAARVLHELGVNTVKAREEISKRAPQL